MNPETVNRYRGRLPISYGDASQPSILESLGIERARAIAIVISDPAAVRAIMVRRMTHSAEDLGSLVDRLPEMGVQALRMDENAPLCEKTLSDTAMRNRFSVTLVAVYRDPHMYPSPDGSFVLKGNDVLYVFGTMDRLYAFRQERRAAACLIRKQKTIKAIRKFLMAFLSGNGGRCKT